MRFTCITGPTLFKVFAFLILQLPLASYGQSGVPQYHNLGSSTLYSNATPLYGVGANQIQFILGPSAFKKAGSSSTLAPNGDISAIYIKLHAVMVSKATYGDFTIKLSQNVDTNTYWRSAKWDTALTTVFYKKSMTLTDTAHHWLKVPLQTNFKYDSSKSLVIEFSVSSGSGYTTAMTWSTNKCRMWGSQGSSTPSGFGQGIGIFGFDLIKAAPNDAGILALNSPKSFCPGKQSLDVQLVNNGSLALDSVRVNWSVNDTLQKPIYFTKKIDIQGSSTGNTKNVNLGSMWFSKNIVRELKVWTSHPNGKADTTNANDTLQTTLRAALNGQYTIGATGSDYKDFSSAAADLNSFGVCGPVHFKIAAGTYTDRLALNSVEGTSAKNTITFEGSGRSSTIIKNDATSTDDWQTILLYGTNHITIKNMRIIGLDSLYSAGIHFVNASHNTVDSCDIIVPDNSYSIQVYGIVGSGDISNGIATSVTGDSNLISNVYIKGGYAGFRWSGSSTFSLSKHIQFVNSEVDSFLRYGVYMLAVGDVLLEGNRIESLRDPNAEGMYLEGMVDIQILNNYVRSTYHGIYLRFVNYYVKSSSQSSVVNNMVITTGSFYAVLRMEYIRKLNVHHNSFLSATFYCLLMADTDSLDIQNNIFENHAKLGNVVAMGSAKFSSNYKMDNNLYYVPNSTSPHVFVGSVSYDSVAQWFSSSTGINQHSINKNPYFKSYTDLHILNKGRYSGDSLGVLTDFDGTTRCLYAPTIGAHELVNKTLPDTSIVHPVCLGDTLAFTLNPPTGLLANDYGKTWALDSLAIETNNGFKTSNYSIRATKGKAVELLFYPDSTDVDSTFLLHFNVLNQSYKGCDSSAGHYIEVHGTPQAGFLIDTNFVCLGHRTKLTNTSITGSSTVQYKWQMGNGFSSTQKALDYTYRKTGFYQIRLTASTPFCQDEITKSIYVGSSKGATIVPDTLFAGRMGDGSALNPDQACVGDTLVYKISAPTGFDNTEYDSLWNISSISWNNTSSTKFDSLTALPDSINDFTLQWLADSSMSGDTLQLTIEVASTLVPNCTNTLIRHIVIGEIPKPIIHHSAACLSSKPIVFTDSTKLSAGSSKSYWRFHNQTLVSNSQHAFQYVDTGKYDVWLRVETNIGCTDSVMKKVHVKPSPKADFSTSSVCLNDTAQFLDSSTKTDLYNWNYGDGNSSNNAVAKHIYNQSGSYEVTLTVTASNGCMDSVSKPIEIWDLPKPDFSVDSVCYPEISHFVNTSIADSNASYQWSFGDDSTSIIKEPKHQFSAIGDYLVTLLVTNGQTSCRDSVTRLANVHPTPKVEFSINDVKGTEKEFTPTQTAGLSFIWYFGDGDSSTDASPVHIYPSVKSDYNVKMHASNKHGCSIERTGLANVWPNSLEKMEGASVSVYPNPFTEKLIISMNNVVEPTTLNLYNATGSLITTVKINGDEQVEIDTEMLPTGVYLLKSNQSQFFYSIKLIKE